MATEGDAPALDPATVVRSRPYLSALLISAALGVPISAVAYGFLALVAQMQQLVFVDLPDGVSKGVRPRVAGPWLALWGS